MTIYIETYTISFIIMPGILRVTNYSPIFLHRQTMVHGMQEIDKLKLQMQDVQVPLEVFE